MEKRNKIKIVKEGSVLPIGSVCEVISRLAEDTIRIRHSSMMGTYEFVIPANITESLK